MARRRRRRNPQNWIMAHPWMTFFLVGGALSVVSTAVIVHGAAKAQQKLPPAGVGAIDFDV
jgi:hypothetical protein